MRQRRRHLRQAVAQAHVHDADDDGGEEQAAETAGRKAEVPAREMAGDDCPDSQRPERPDTRMLAQLAIGEVLRSGLVVFDSRYLLPFSHDIPPGSFI